MLLHTQRTFLFALNILTEHYFLLYIIRMTPDEHKYAIRVRFTELLRIVYDLEGRSGEEVSWMSSQIKRTLDGLVADVFAFESAKREERPPQGNW